MNELEFIFIEYFIGRKWLIIRIEYKNEKLQVKIPAKCIKFRKRIIERMLRSHFNINFYD